MSQGSTTVNHDEIRKWAEQRGGRPTRVRGTESRDGAGILRFDFAEPDDKLEEISWEEFFETFDDRELALLYQDKTADGQTSRFFKFVHRSESTGAEGDRAETARESGGSHSRSRPSDGTHREAANDAPHRGSVKDPERDGRLKENREAGRTKGTTAGSEARAQERGRDTASDKQDSSSRSDSDSRSGSESDDLKSREYKDADGNVHHHTRTYQESRKK